MSSVPGESQGWARQRWLAIIGLVLLFQMAVIFWLARHGTPPKSPAIAIKPPKVFQPTDSSADSLGVIDQTILVRTSKQGFSGPAWMQPPTLPYEQPKWTDPSPPTNDLRVQRLGGTLNQFLQTNRTAAIELAPKPEPELPVIVPENPLDNLQSTLTIGGGLANRALLRPIKLDSWPATETVEILSNSVVQVGVDQDGNVFSAVLVTSCGSKDADSNALTLANAARFEPLSRRHAGEPDAQTWGQLVFHWHTTAASPVTNNSVLKP